MFVLKEGSNNGEGTTPEIESQMVSYLEGKGLTIRNEEQEKSFLQSNIDSVLSKRNSQLEQTIEKLTGSKKESEQKWVDYLENSIKTLKQKPTELQSTVDGLNSQIEELKNGKVGNDELLTEYKKQIDSLQKQISAISQEKDSLQSDFSKKILESKVNSQINSLVDSRKPFRRKDYDANVINDTIENRISKRKSQLEAKDVDGVLIWYENGEPLMSQKDGKNLSTNQVFEMVFEGLETEKPPVSGGGSNNNGQGSQQKPSDKKPSDINLPEKVTNWVELHKYLKEDLSMDEATPEFSQKFDELKVDLRMR